MSGVGDVMCTDTAHGWKEDPCRCVVQPETDVAEAARAMLRQTTDRALVLDRGKVVGILTLTDALKAILATTDDRWAA